MGADNDYTAYDLETLCGLARQGDAEATFRYALNPNLDPDTAIAHFKISLINSDYNELI